MSPWQVTDIRRTLPEYRTREGDDVYNAPYRATDVDLNAFLLHADTSALQKLVGEQLNAPLRQSPPLLGSQQELEFDCTDSWIMLIFAAFSALASVDKVDRSNGSVSAYELSVWVPIQKRQKVAGAVISKPAWFLPLVYTAPTASVATGREVFGYPKIPAYLTTPTAGGPPNAVRLRHSLDAAGPQGRASKRNRTFFKVEGAPLPEQPSVDASLLEDPLLRAVVGRFFANIPLIFRKQAGIHETPQSGMRAGYTALIESKVPISRLSSVNPIGPSTTTGIVDVLAPAVVDGLGIKGRNALQGVAVRGCTLDVQAGSEIWVARNEMAYIKPLPAPGNDLMRGFQAASAYDLLPRRARPKRARLATEDAGALNEIPHASGEAYFVPPRPHAISALLSRHFPTDLSGEAPLPDPDPARQFVVISLTRAKVTTADVRLYELCVMVPVLHGPKLERCWYIPYMFRSPGAAVIHAREWFGHPCQEGFIELKDDESPRKVSFNFPTALGPDDVRWIKRDGVVIRPEPAARGYAGAVRQAAAHWVGQQHVVGLLQTRHAADTTRACFQAIVRSQRLVQATRMEPTGAKLSLHSGLRLGRLLDLDDPTMVVPGVRFKGLSIETTLPTLHVRETNSA